MSISVQNFGSLFSRSPLPPSRQRALYAFLRPLRPLPQQDGPGAEGRGPAGGGGGDAAAGGFEIFRKNSFYLIIFFSWVYPPISPPRCPASIPAPLQTHPATKVSQKISLRQFPTWMEPIFFSLFRSHLHGIGGNAERISPSLRTRLWLIRLWQERPGGGNFWKKRQELTSHRSVQKYFPE